MDIETCNNTTLVYQLNASLRDIEKSKTVKLSDHSIAVLERNQRDIHAEVIKRMAKKGEK